MTDDASQMQNGRERSGCGPSRAMLFLGCVSASALPALLLTQAFARDGDFFRVLLLCWEGILLGPFSEWVLYGVSPRVAWLCVATICLPLMLAHALRPTPITAAMTVGGFALWDAASSLIIVNREVQM